MRRFLVVAALFVAIAACNAGCTFTKDRLKDSIDVIGFKVLGGPGSKVGIGFGASKVGATFGYYRFEKFGFQGRAMGVTEETGVEFIAPADHRLEAVWGNKELFDMVKEFQEVDGYASRTTLFDAELTYPRRRFHTPDGFHVADWMPGSYPNPFLQLGDIQITFAPLFGGIEVNLSFYQLADWFLGFFYIDIAKDDTRNYTPVGPTDDE